MEKRNPAAKRERIEAECQPAPSNVEQERNACVRGAADGSSSRDFEPSPAENGETYCGDFLEFLDEVFCGYSGS